MKSWSFLWVVITLGNVLGHVAAEEKTTQDLVSLKSHLSSSATKSTTSQKLFHPCHSSSTSSLTGSFPHSDSSSDSSSSSNSSSSSDSSDASSSSSSSSCSSDTSSSSSSSCSSDTSSSSSSSDSSDTSSSSSSDSSDASSSFNCSSSGGSLSATPSPSVTTTPTPTVPIPLPTPMGSTPFPSSTNCTITPSTPLPTSISTNTPAPAKTNSTTPVPLTPVPTSNNTGTPVPSSTNSSTITPLTPVPTSKAPLTPVPSSNSTGAPVPSSTNSSTIAPLTPVPSSNSTGTPVPSSTNSSTIAPLTPLPTSNSTETPVPSSMNSSTAAPLTPVPSITATPPVTPVPSSSSASTPSPSSTTTVPLTPVPTSNNTWTSAPSSTSKPPVSPLPTSSSPSTAPSTATPLTPQPTSNLTPSPEIPVITTPISTPSPILTDPIIVIPDSKTIISNSCRCQQPCQLFSNTTGVSTKHLCHPASPLTGKCPKGYTTCVSSSMYQLQWQKPFVKGSTQDVIFDVYANDIINLLERDGEKDIDKIESWYFTVLIPGNYQSNQNVETTVTMLSTGESFSLPTGTFGCNNDACQSFQPISTPPNHQKRTTDTLLFMELSDFFRNQILSRNLQTFRLVALRFNFHQALTVPFQNDNEKIVKELRIQLFAPTSSTTTKKNKRYLIEKYKAGIPVSFMELPRDLEREKLQIGYFYSNHQQQTLTFSITTRTIALGQRSDSNLAICVNLFQNSFRFHHNSKSHHQNNHTSHFMSFGFSSRSVVSYSNTRKRNNPFLSNNCAAQPVIKVTNDTFFCLHGFYDPLKSCHKQQPRENDEETQLDFTISNLKYAMAAFTNQTNLNESPYVFGVQVRQFGINTAQGVLQASFDEGNDEGFSALSIYSVVSITFYTFAFCGAFLLIRMNGMSFSAESFWKDMTSLSVVLVLLFAILSHFLWLVSSRSTPVFYLFDRVSYMCMWTSVTSFLCCQLSSSLFLFRSRLFFGFVVTNFVFYVVCIWLLVDSHAFLTCSYTYIYQNPSANNIPSGAAMQPFHWSLSSTELCTQEHEQLWMGFRLSTQALICFVVFIILVVVGQQQSTTAIPLVRGSQYQELTDISPTTTSSECLEEENMKKRKKKIILVCGVGLIFVVLLIKFVLSTSLYYDSNSTDPIPSLAFYVFLVWLPLLVPTMGLLALETTLVSTHMEEEESFDVEQEAQLFTLPEYNPLVAKTHMKSMNTKNSLAISLCLSLPSSKKSRYYLVLFAPNSSTNDLNWLRIGTTEIKNSSTSKQLEFLTVIDCPITYPIDSCSNLMFVLYEIQLNDSAEDKEKHLVCCEFTLPLVDLLPSSLSFSTEDEEKESEIEENIKIVKATSSNFTKEKPGQQASLEICTELQQSDAFVYQSANTHRHSLLRNPSMYRLNNNRSFHQQSWHENDSNENDEMNEFIENDVMQTNVALGKYRSRMFCLSQRNLSANRQMFCEEMYEFKMLNEIPRLYLQELVKSRVKQLQSYRCQLMAKSTPTAKHWLQNQVKLYEQYLETIRECFLAGNERNDQQVFFKASVEKKNRSLAFLPTNLHIQQMTVAESRYLLKQQSGNEISSKKVYIVTTVGAFAAHYLKFRHGGILTLIKKIEKCRSKLQHEFARKKRNAMSSASSASSTSSSSSQNYMEEKSRLLGDLRWQLRQRVDVVLSQFITTLVASFSSEMEKNILPPQLGDRAVNLLGVLQNVGFLFDVESLLSTHGKEVGMLEDLAGLFQYIAGNVVIQFRPKSNRTNSNSSNNSSSQENSLFTNGELESRIIGVSLKITEQNDEDLDEEEKKMDFNVHVVIILDVLAPHLSHALTKKSIHVTPVVFTQGINEKQTIANNMNFKKIQLQNEINAANFTKLANFCHGYSAYIDGIFHMLPTAVERNVFVTRQKLNAQLTQLEHNILAQAAQSLKTKMPAILRESSAIARSLGCVAGRVTSCKSAKDRTGMAVTLEQLEILTLHHNLANKEATLETMRSNGVRIENCWKNTGKRQYAFNSLQRSLLPEEYRCPIGTIGANVVS